MTAPIFEENIKEEMQGCDGNKSLGPDGFNLHFAVHYGMLGCGERGQ